MIAATKAFRQPVGAWFVLVDEWQNALKPLGLKGFEPAIITAPDPMAIAEFTQLGNCRFQPMTPKGSVSQEIVAKGSRSAP